MKHKFTLIGAAILFVLGFVATTRASTPISGSGTASDPYIIVQPDDTVLELLSTNQTPDWYKNGSYVTSGTLFISPAFESDSGLYVNTLGGPPYSSTRFIIK